MQHLRFGIALCVLIACSTSCKNSHKNGDSSTASSSSSSSSSSSGVSIALKPDLTPDPQLPTRGSPNWNKAAEAARFLSRASFGPTAKDIDYIIQNGKAAWVEQQLALPATPQLKLFTKRLQDLGFTPYLPWMINFADLSAEEYHFERVVFQHHIWMETAIWGQDQLRARVAQALSQILEVSQFGAAEFHRETGFANYTDILMEGAFGN